jgi:hypothetical protein
MTEEHHKRASGAARSTARSLSLKERFERFMASGDLAERTDALTLTDQIPGRRKADYLARNRSVIIEQKSIDHDIDARVRTFLADFIREHGPLDAEHITLAGIIDAVVKLPPPNPFRTRLRAILTQRIDDYLAEADKQTRDTRLTFSIPEAIGIVVVLNEHAPLSRITSWIRHGICSTRRWRPEHSGTLTIKSPFLFQRRTVFPHRMAAR